MNIRIAIDHDRSQIPVVSKTVRHLCVLTDAVDHPLLNNIELAVVELLTNIVNYGGRDTDSEIKVQCRFDGDALTLDIADSGNPLSSDQAHAYTDEHVNMPGLELDSDIDLDLDIDSLPESGWGIQLIKSACDQVSYKRKDQQNKYKLVFDLSAAVT